MKYDYSVQGEDISNLVKVLLTPDQQMLLDHSLVTVSKLLGVDPTTQTLNLQVLQRSAQCDS